MKSETKNAEKQVTLNVVVTRTGYHNLRRYKEGQTLTIGSVEEFSAAWMEPKGDVPPEWKSEIDLRIANFAKRKTPEELRREATEKRAKADAILQAQIIAQAVAGAIGPAVEQALALQRAEHERLLKEATGKK